MNSFGERLRLTTFGESHGPAVGGVLDGMPPRIPIDAARVQKALDERRPGASPLASQRREPDRVQILSGIYEGLTLGTPIGFIIPNTDARPADYDQLRDLYRPCHADYTYQAKYGIRDYRGGGRASARETACRVAAGALAEQALTHLTDIKISAFITRIGSIYSPEGLNEELYAPEIAAAKLGGDTVGGAVSVRVSGVPAGLGEPLYGKLQAKLAAAMLSIPAAKGFEYGMGFSAASARGSECIDTFIPDPAAPGSFITEANHSGGIQGGISNGADILFSVPFKPAATLMRPLRTVDMQGRPATLEPRGRHDACVVPRAVPVVRAMTALVLLDALLLAR